ncbi:MAG TPA: HAD family phosphatase [Acidimicrobiales bacterium]|nr:HAD family phosphatase [Acidimicrobiales bacterium]
MPALIFDYDGLMVDTERVLAECIVEAVTEWGGSVTFADFGHLFGSVDADHEWARLLPTWCGRDDLTMEHLAARITPDVRSRVEALPLLPGVTELLEAARAAGWAVGLGTGQRRERLEVRLARFGIEGHFDAIVTRAEVPHGKPAPDIFLAVADRLGVAPPDCVVLEDSVPGSHAAVAAGMRVVVCPSPVSVHCEFPPEARRVASLTELSLEDLV